LHELLEEALDVAVGAEPSLRQLVGRRGLHLFGNGEHDEALAEPVGRLLLAFNLVPALPLDGGRILRAQLWRRTGVKAWATVAAARAGRAFGLLLIASGYWVCSPARGSVPSDSCS
jgi:hypothetical protein